MKKAGLAVVLACAWSGAGWCAAGDASKAPAGHKKASLYERLGGLKPITLVVDDFVDRLVADDTLNANPAIKAGRDNSPAPYLKVQVSILICKVTGGPCNYTGRSMKDAHKHMNITEAEWQAMAADFQKTLDKFKVPEAEQKELFAIVGTTKKDIVMAQAPAASKP